MVALHPSAWRSDSRRSAASTGLLRSASVRLIQVARCTSVSAGSRKKRNEFSTFQAMRGSACAAAPHSATSASASAMRRPASIHIRLLPPDTCVDAGSPTLIHDTADEDTLYVLMPMRV